MSYAPAEALWQFSAAVHGPEERRVAVASEAHEKLLAFLHALEARHSVGTAGNGVQHVVDEVGSQTLVC